MELKGLRILNLHLYNPIITNKRGFWEDYKVNLLHVQTQRIKAIQTRQDHQLVLPCPLFLQWSNDCTRVLDAHYSKVCAFGDERAGGQVFIRMAQVLTKS